MLPWTAMPMVVAPIAGALSERIGARPILALGLALQAVGLAWIAAVSTATVGYSSLVGPFIVSGIGMGLFFAPMAYVILGAGGPDEEGKASGANNAVREVGGVFGVAVLASVFSRYGGYESAETFNDGLVVATWVGAVVVAAGAVAALAIPGRKQAETGRRACARGRLESRRQAWERPARIRPPRPPTPSETDRPRSRVGPRRGSRPPRPPG